MVVVVVVDDAGVVDAGIVVVVEVVVAGWAFGGAGMVVEVVVATVVVVVLGGGGIVVVCRVTGSDALDTVPVPAALTAMTRNVYCVPFVKPVTVALVAVDTPSTKVVQVVPFEENWTM